MSIVLNENAILGNIPSFLDIQGQQFHTFTAEDLLLPIWNAGHNIWQDVDLTSYTDHTLKHSLRILSLFRKFVPFYELSKLERALFAAAAIIHDLGMQFNVWGRSFLPPGFSKPPWPWDDVRKMHIETGAALVFNYIDSEQIDWTFPPAFTTGRQNENILTNLSRAAHIAFAHSGTRYLEILQNDAGWNKREIEDQEYRPRLLAGILRICDQLDLSFLRLRQENRMWGTDISAESRRHWMLCMFVEGIGLELDAHGVANISIGWRCPRGWGATDSGQIHDYLGATIERNIISEIERVNTFYRKCGEPQHNLNYLVGFREAPTEFVYTERGRLLELLRAEIRRIYSPPRLADDGGRPPAVSLEIVNVEDSVDADEDLRVPTDLQDGLWAWFKRHREKRHYQLLSGEHTDTYLDCRALLEDQTMTIAIADYVYRLFRKRGIGAVVGVGTSAIPIAVYSAVRLNVPVSFTVSTPDPVLPKSALSTKVGPRYPWLEIEAAVSGHSSILILDDIVSAGRSAELVAKQIRISANAPSASMHYLALFRLGSRSLDTIENISSVEWLCHVPNVSYALRESECPQCIAGEPLVTEEDMT